MSVMRIEVVYALPGRQMLRRVSLNRGSTVEDALRASGLSAECPEIDALRAGIFGTPAPRDTVLRDGDRVEIYRPLRSDPKEARRARATKKRAKGRV
jgi:putative ubiquitin-RnfH superfamily antitoxin RatB of RatAB toxin-antitoxin module